MTRTVLVTGSASGIGLAAAVLLRTPGHKVIGADLRDADIIADLATPAGRSVLADSLAALSGGVLDAVIANAGVLQPDRLCYAINCYGAIATLEAARPLLAKSAAPRALVTASFAAAAPLHPWRAPSAGRRGRIPPQHPGSSGGGRGLWREQIRHRPLGSPRRDDAGLGRSRDPAQRGGAGTDRNPPLYCARFPNSDIA